MYRYVYQIHLQVDQGVTFQRLWKIGQEKMTLNGGSISLKPARIRTNNKEERNIKTAFQMITRQNHLSGWTKVLSQALIYLNDQPIGPVTLICQSREPCGDTNTITYKICMRQPLPCLSPWINMIRYWEHQAPSPLGKSLSTGICSEMSHWDVWVTAHSWVMGTIQSPLGSCPAAKWTYWDTLCL